MGGLGVAGRPPGAETCQWLDSSGRRAVGRSSSLPPGSTEGPLRPSGTVGPEPLTPEDVTTLGRTPVLDGTLSKDLHLSQPEGGTEKKKKKKWRTL